MASLKKDIENNIDTYGFHILIVNNREFPRYAYTIGLSKKIGIELLFAGGIYFLKDDVFSIINKIADTLINEKVDLTRLIEVSNSDSFLLKKMDISWSKLLLRQVSRFNPQWQFSAYQIIPNKFITRDIPNASNEYNPDSEPVWKYLTKEWNYNISPNSLVSTNIETLQGESVLEVMRWEENYWEMFSRNPESISKKEIRIVPFSTMIGVDKTLLSAITLSIGKGFWRESSNVDWIDWEVSSGG